MARADKSTHLIAVHTCPSIPADHTHASGAELESIECDLSAFPNCNFFNGANHAVTLSSASRCVPVAASIHHAGPLSCSTSKPASSARSMSVPSPQHPAPSFCMSAQSVRLCGHGVRRLWSKACPRLACAA
eukprot:364282-Chlamydomonas_euryale.AAC.3